MSLTTHKIYLYDEAAGVTSFVMIMKGDTQATVCSTIHKFDGGEVCTCGKYSIKEYEGVMQICLLQQK